MSEGKIAPTSMLRVETVSSLMQKLSITEEEAKLLIEKVTKEGHL